MAFTLINFICLKFVKDEDVFFVQFLQGPHGIENLLQDITALKGSALILALCLYMFINLILINIFLI